MCECFSAVGVGAVIKHLWRAASGVMCECPSAVVVGTVIRHLWRTASGVMCKWISSVGVGTVFLYLWRASSGAMCKCFSAVGVGTVRAPLARSERRHVRVLQRSRGKKTLSPARHVLKEISYQTRPKIVAGDASLLMGSII